MEHNFILLPATATIMVAILLSLSPPTAANSAVVDLAGNPLEAGSRYFVQTLGKGAAGRGGLRYWFKGQQFCPAYVFQHSSESDLGEPISFYLADSSQEQITEGDDVYISFNNPNYCEDRGTWRLTLDKETMIPYVATDGQNGNSGAETSASLFKIQRSVGNSYKIVYCFERPEARDIVMGVKEEICQQLDATQPSQYKFSFLSLVPIDQPLPFLGFVFRKAFTPTLTTTY